MPRVYRKITSEEERQARLEEYKLKNAVGGEYCIRRYEKRNIKRDEQKTMKKEVKLLVERLLAERILT